MPEQKRRPNRDGAVLLGGEQPVPTEITTQPQSEIALDSAMTKSCHASLRARLAAAAYYGQEARARALSPCSCDLAWWICRIGNRYADDTNAPLSEIQRELRRVEHLWRACMEVERLEFGELPVDVTP